MQILALLTILAIASMRFTSAAEGDFTFTPSAATACNHANPADPSCYHNMLVPIPESDFVTKPKNPGDKEFTLKAHSNGEYVGEERSSQINYQSMSSVPLPGTQFEPTTSGIKSAFVAEMAGSGSGREGANADQGIVVAQGSFNTKKPMVILDNFAQIKKVECSSGNRVYVTFDSSESASAAQRAWTRHTQESLGSQGNNANMVVMIGHEWKCYGNEVQFLDVVSVAQESTESAAGLSKLLLTTTQADKDAVIDEYDFSFAHYKASPQAVRALRKRSIFDWNRRSDNLRLPLTVNYNEASKSASWKDIPLFVSQQISLLCADCYTHGSATFNIQIRGTLLWIKQYQVTMQGEVKLNMDLTLRLRKIQQSDLFRWPLFTLPISPIQIPGVIALAPSIGLDAAITYGCDADFDIKAGFDIVQPWDYTVSSTSNAGVFSKPEIIDKASDRVVTVHPLDTTKDFQFRLGAHLIPKVSLGVNAFSKNLLALALSFDNELGVQFSRGSFAAPKCPDARDVFKIGLYHHHALALALITPVWSHAWPLWNSGIRTLPCPKGTKCEWCLGGGKTSTSSQLPLPTSTSEPVPTATSTATSSSVISTTTTSLWKPAYTHPAYRNPASPLPTATPPAYGRRVAIAS